MVQGETSEITGMVVVDDTADYGAAASAPTYAKIARAALEEFSIPPMPKQPPPPGVPLSTNASATGAGEIAGTPLPGMSATPTVAHPATASTTAPSSTTPPTTVAPASGGTAGTSGGPAGGNTTTTAPATTSTTRARSSPTTG